MRPRIFGPILFILVGAIMQVGLKVSSSKVNLHNIGWILIGLGVLWLVIELFVNRQRTAVATSRQRVVDPANPANNREVIHESEQDII